MNMPLVSVIIPVYNGGEYVRRSSSSVLNQTLHDLELILVDDGSESDTAQLCDEIAATDVRVQVIHKENGGISSARNVGIDHASGEYIAFVDQDDYVLADMYETLYSRAAGEYDVVFSDFNLVYSDNTVLYKTFDVHEKYEDTYKDMLLHGYGGNIWNMIILRSLVLKSCLRFPEHLRHCEDVYFSWRLFLNTEKLAKVDFAYYQYNLANPNQVSNNLDDRFNECARENIDEFIDYMKSRGVFSCYQEVIYSLILRIKSSLVLDPKHFELFNIWHSEANRYILSTQLLGCRMKMQMLLVSLHMYSIAGIISKYYKKKNKWLN